MIDTSPFGNTGHQSTRVIFGAAALSKMSQESADRVLEVLLEYGINHIDTAAVYGDSELRIGLWMREHRKRFFFGDQDSRAHIRWRARQPPSIARTAAGGSCGFDPVAQSGRGKRVGDCARTARRT